MTVKMSRIRQRIQCMMQLVCLISTALLVGVFTVTKDRAQELSLTKCQQIIQTPGSEVRQKQPAEKAEIKPNNVNDKPAQKAIQKNNHKPKLSFDSLSKGTGKTSEEYRTYIKLRSERFSKENISFINSGETICPKNSAVFLLVICVSEHYNVDGRKALRDTWASVVKTQTWPRRKERFSVKLAFLLANPGTSAVQKAVVKEEINKYRDIVLVDINERVQSQSKRFMAGLKWTSEFCNQAKFVMRVDENVFVHIPNLVDYLKPFKILGRGLFIGNVQTNQPPLRGGKLLINQTVYPFDIFPPYLSLPTYVISGNIVSKLLAATEHLPYIYSENIFITGIAREAIRAEIKHKPEIMMNTEKPSGVCDLHKKGQISLTYVKNSIKTIMWKAQKYPNCTEEAA